MSHTVKVWRSLGAVQVELTRATLPACPGNFLEHPGECRRRPDHVITYGVNPSGLPGLASEEVIFACFRHVHRALQHAEAASVGRHAIVTAYKGK